MKKRTKKQALFFVVFLAMTLMLISAGCSEQSSGKKMVTDPQVSANVPRSFYNRTIVYMVEPEARDTMVKLENLLAFVEGEEDSSSLSDETVLPIYRDADISPREHIISKMEAENFYQQTILEFEDSHSVAHYKLKK